MSVLMLSKGGVGARGPKGTRGDLPNRRSTQEYPRDPETIVPNPSICRTFGLCLKLYRMATFRRRVFVEVLRFLVYGSKPPGLITHTCVRGSSGENDAGDTARTAGRIDSAFATATDQPASSRSAKPVGISATVVHLNGTNHQINRGCRRAEQRRIVEQASAPSGRRSAPAHQKQMVSAVAAQLGRRPTS